MAEFSFFAVIPERTDGNTGSIESHRKPQLTFERILSFATRFYHYANASFQNDGKKGGSLYRQNLLQTFYYAKKSFTVA